MVFFRKRGRRKVAVSKTVETDYRATSYNAENISDGTASSAVAYAVGKSADNSGKGGNIYSSGSGKTGYVTYTFGSVSIPQDAQNISISIAVKGGREDTSQGKLEAQMLWVKENGSIYVGDKLVFTSLTSSIKSTNVDNETLFALANPRGVSERDIALNVCLYVEVGWYGGHVDGITYTVSYDVYE